jgi:coatomer protein complex subunit alpha (xenin)
VNAASFARRLLELPDTNSERHADTRSKAQKVLQKSEQQGRNEFKIEYDEMNPFRCAKFTPFYTIHVNLSNILRRRCIHFDRYVRSLDCAALKPIYRGSPSIKCPYCSAVYSPASKGTTCAVCNLCKVTIVTVVTAISNID